MYNAFDIDQKLAEHVARVARVDREAWKRESLASTGVSHTWGRTSVIGQLRRHFGGAVVRLGVRVQGPSVGRATTEPAA